MAVGCETEPVSGNEEFLGFAQHVSTPSRSEGPDAVDSLEDERVELVAKLGENIEVVGAARFEADDGEVLAAYIHPPAQKIGVLVRARRRPSSRAWSRCTSPSRTRASSTRDEVPDDEVAAEREHLREAPRRRGRSRRTSGRRSSKGCSRSGFFAEAVLRDQAWIHDPDQTVGQALAEHGAEVREFVRYALAG